MPVSLIFPRVDDKLAQIRRKIIGKLQTIRLGNRDFSLPVKGLISGCFFDFSMDLIENGGFGASPIRTSVASFPSVFFFM